MDKAYNVALHELRYVMFMDHPLMLYGYFTPEAFSKQPQNPISLFFLA